MNIILPSTGSAVPSKKANERIVASQIKHPVITHSVKIEANAPITSARAKPNVKFFEAGLVAITVARRAMAKPAISVNKCAASDKMAKELAQIPPAISHSMKVNDRQIANVKRVFLSIPIVPMLVVVIYYCDHNNRNTRVNE